MGSFKKLSLCVATVAALSGATAAQAFTIDEAFEGQWFEGDIDARRGWNLQYFPAGPELGVLFAVGFVYDDQGNPQWVNGAGTVVPGQFDVDIPLELVEGGSWGPGEGNPAVTDGNFGSLNVEFHSCKEATISWTDNAWAAGADSNDFDNLLTIAGGPGLDRCVYQEAFTQCPAFSTPAAFPRTCILSGTYTQDIKLTNNTIWVLAGGVFIGDKDAEDNDNAIWIEPGTRIIGSGGVDTLIVSRGAKIYAEGLPHAPIVFSGPNTASEGASSGDWGGLVVNGFAPLNTCTTPPCTALGEGDTGTYGGDDPDDSSGVLRYVRVQFAGIKFTDEDELNGIALQGVGRGTVVDHVQVHRNADDGIEFFGGTVNAKHLILTDIEDDSVDWTQGWQGLVQHVLVRQIDDLEVDTDHGVEADSLSGDNDAMPRAQPRIANMTLLGKPGERGILFREGTGANVTNSIVYGFDRCIDIDGSATFAAAGDPNNLTGVLTMENTIVMCNTTNFEEEGGDPWSIAAWFNAQPGNVAGDPQLDGMFPSDASPYTSGFPIDPTVFNDFFEDVDYIGAFRSEESAWHYNWSEFLD